MCGIAGIINKGAGIHITETLLREMAYPLRYRGPDQEGYYLRQDTDCAIGMAHKRLSIIDLSENGKQPMHSADGMISIVFNGEIYNYKSIKQKLKNDGCRFRTDSDTEVIIVAYQQWGIERALDEMEGMFAFALYDSGLGATYIARDRFGEKPLYYYHSGDTLAFSSDIRSFDVLGISKTINNEAIGYYLSEMCTPIDHSVWTEIKKLRPGHYIKYDTAGLAISKYWQLQYTDKINISIQDAIERSEYLLEESIKKRLVADTPVGCFLSGGIDSSLVTLLAARNYNRRIQTFSVGFEYEAFNELPYAKQVAEKVGSEHHEIILNPNDLDITDALLYEYGEPFADSSQLPTYYVSKFAASMVKVTLGGDGGDEIFAGYNTYKQGLRMQQWHDRRILHPLMATAATLTRSEKAKYLAGVMKMDAGVLATSLYRNMGFHPDEVHRLLDGHSSAATAALRENKAIMTEALQHTGNVFDAVLYASMKTRLVNDYLVKTDRASMFTSLELRTPFLDRDLMEFVSTLSHDQLLKDNTSKYITKKISEKYFSKEFIYRPKMGFGIPIGEWIKKEWKSHVTEVLNYKNTLVPMNQKYIDKLLKEHIEGERDHTHRIWTIYVLNRWAERNTNAR